MPTKHDLDRGLETIHALQEQRNPRFESPTSHSPENIRRWRRNWLNNIRHKISNLSQPNMNDTVEYLGKRNPNGSRGQESGITRLN